MYQPYYMGVSLVIIRSPVANAESDDPSAREMSGGLRARLYEFGTDRRCIPQHYIILIGYHLDDLFSISIPF